MSKYTNASTFHTLNVASVQLHFYFMACIHGVFLKRHNAVVCCLFYQSPSYMPIPKPLCVKEIRSTACVGHMSSILPGCCLYAWSLAHHGFVYAKIFTLSSLSVRKHHW